MINFKRTLFLLSFVLIAQFGFTQTEPHAFYLTWTSDPTTTMDVDWHMDEINPTTLYLRKKGTEKWKSLESDVLPYPFSSRYIHRVGIQGLRPNTEYELKFASSESVYYFRTLPKNLNNKSLKIAIGGDSMHQKEWLEKTNRVVTAQDPDFVIIGGDMAYENGLAENIQRIYDWFDAYKNTLVTADKRILPCIVAAGNHEVVGGYYTKHEGYVQNNEFRARIAPYFYSLFSFPGQPGYNVLDFGNYLSLIILDTEHSNPILGVQTDWLTKTFEERKKVNHKIPIYHVPAFPSVREYSGTVQTLVRETWTPIFEANGVEIAFENHDHAYKRTFPIKNMEVNEAGIIYVGDGSYGVTPRKIHSVDSTWYLNKAQSIRAFTLLTVEENRWSLVSIDEDGNVIDTFPDSPLAVKKDD
ncbi:metallophosphoesterase family protein [Aquiflexum sp. TKW24L]|uniref:purple acid phosphatase family protein n=1 Tax=Aquiflexum sp. TKW24L TaxID=2942212 RepID=UPI0020BDC68A|nr:metallophosphoesterase family protein [Aquiflexum sp. TKW24L]MCL6258690.1 metallophosphoesterase family protein [Aquiflexum sp. TKW24L]